MSPYMGAAPRASASGASRDPRRAESGAPARTEAQRAAGLEQQSDEADWKLQRKLKQQRDAAKRSAVQARADAPAPAGRAEPVLRPKIKGHHLHQHHHHQHGGRQNLDIRPEQDFTLAKPAPRSSERTIPGRRRDKRTPRSTTGSLPVAGSWPPVSSATAIDGAAGSRDADRVLSTSEPADAALSRSYGSRREARTLTLFETATFYNEAGHLLSHDNLDELGSSPDMPRSAKRKPGKRRVGRRKNDYKRSDVSDAMNPDEVVLELMCFLLPDVDVRKELNLRFLGSGQQHGGDVFDFDDDEELTGSSSTMEHGAGVDLIKFQAGLTTMLFGMPGATGEVSQRGTVADDLVETYFDDRWLSKTILDIVKLDVLAQHDQFAVVEAIFRVCSEKRMCILRATVTASLAIFQHQGINAVSLGGQRDVVFVSMAGILRFLGVALDIITSDLQRAPELFGDSPDAIDCAVMDMCGRISQALKLLVRSSPGSSRMVDENANQIEKFSEASDSTEATTYRALGELLYRLTSFCPVFGEDFLRWIMLKWPQRNVQLELFFMRFTAGLLATFMQCGLVLPHDVVQQAFVHIRRSIRSPQFLIAKEACTICSNLALMEVYLARDSSLRATVAEALHESARSHWNQRIRAMADERFDMLLDLA